MKAVGLRELENRLSEYIREVRAGESVLVTDRGEVVAELGPPGHGAGPSHHPPGLQALVARAAVPDLALLSLDEAVRAHARALGLPLQPHP